LVYLDTSVLLVYTLTHSSEVKRAKIVDKLVAKISSGLIEAAASFYSLHELYIFALENVPDFDAGSSFGKAALEKILRLPIRVLPLPSRTDRRRLAGKFAALRDASDIPHAISAYLARCEAIVAYDDPFKSIADVIP
jgi:hypothetical protein